MNVNMNDNTIIATSSVSVNTPREEKLINLKEALIMTLVPMTQMLKNARANKCAVGGFMIWNYDSARAIADTAQKLGLPAIYIIGEGEAISMGGFANVARIAESVAKTVDVLIALHADHFRSYDAIVQAIVAGYSSVMIDASRFPLKENIRLTKEVVKVAHAAGVSVEAELGRLPGNEGDEDVTVEESFQTDPEEAAYFAEQTGIDALAVSIGTMHGAYPKSFKPEINIQRLMEIEKKVSIPLVMHGGSGTPQDKIAEAVNHGIAKINIATDLVTAAAKRIADVQQADDFRYNVTTTFQAGKEAISEVVEQRMRLLNQNIL